MDDPLLYVIHLFNACPTYFQSHKMKLGILNSKEKMYDSKMIHLKQIMRISLGILDRKWQIFLLSSF